MKRILFAAALLLTVPLAFADGGRLRSRTVAGPFVVTLFTTPDPLRAGMADFSVAVERPGEQGIVQDAEIDLKLTTPGQPDLNLKLTHGAATSRFLEAANFELPHAGHWHYTLTIREGQDTGISEGEVNVLPRQILSEEITWEIAAVPLALALFALHRRRKRAWRETIRRSTTRSA
ncbi:hypothetical protein [Silvibacterium dinghuense]|uniref:YtkA-like domain-containing protein n=1 Tax=Silvibacterium dinghuense TaxID=1560006 RepID=A0A4Q1S8Q5_9BACT|nr:hypothetical protein [Silvibacterium dinghuense]RXS93352.1 hypothetical protein ESZ00_18555 [Silvibacterium dinghuense]GGH05130.1 hypothetical protein GCM10011586_21560 [Silvibacterium dinghuense]